MDEVTIKSFSYSSVQFELKWILKLSSDVSASFTQV